MAVRNYFPGLGATVHQIPRITAWVFLPVYSRVATEHAHTCLCDQISMLHAPLSILCVQNAAQCTHRWTLKLSAFLVAVNKSWESTNIFYGSPCALQPPLCLVSLFSPLVLPQTLRKVSSRVCPLQTIHFSSTHKEWRPIFCLLKLPGCNRA